MMDWIKQLEQRLSGVSVGDFPVWRIGVFVLIILTGYILSKIAQATFNRLFIARKSSGYQPFVFVFFKILADLSPFLILCFSLAAGLQVFRLNDFWLSWIVPLSHVLVIVAISRVSYRLIDLVEVAFHGLTKRRHSELDNMLVPLIQKSLRVTLLVLTVLQIATVMSDRPLTSILAGLGVGGLAVALAAQETIKNFFGSLVIFADKPFEMGDVVKIDSFNGVVEEVGFRSTRIRTVEGNLVTIPNGELANKSIENITRRPHIRQTFIIGIEYSTPVAKIKECIEFLDTTLSAKAKAFDPNRPYRVFLDSLGDFSLNIRVFYWFQPADLWLFSVFHSDLLLEVFEGFERLGVQFAFPTQTIHMHKTPVIEKKLET